jgi:N-methylhydantoinase B
MDIGKTKGLTLRPGDRLCVETGGGGGYGTPEDRDLALIERDVYAGYVSRAAAEADYGVEFDDSGKVHRGGARN